MNNKNLIFFAAALFFLIGILGGCATQMPQDTRTTNQENSTISQNPEKSLLPGNTKNSGTSDLNHAKEIIPPKVRKLVAIAGFENKSTYASDKLWDTSSQLLASHLIQTGYFRVVEWEKMKQLFDWDDLSMSGFVKNPEKRTEARKILLCEYFISGAVTLFDVNQTANVSAISKNKVIETTIRVDLLLQDAFTGEYLSASNGQWTEKQEFKGGLTGGKIGTWDPKSADTALNNAIQEALYKLVYSFSKQAESQ